MTVKVRTLDSPGLAFHALVGVCLSVAIAAPARMDAQSVRVEVRAELPGTRLQGLLLSILNGRDSTVAQGFTDASGVRTFAALAPGTYRVRVRRIGFTPITSDAVAVTPASSSTVRLTIPTTPVSLPAITVTAMAKECSGHDDNAAAAAEVWQQARTALLAGEYARSNSLVHTRVRTFERQISPGGNLTDATWRDLGVTGAHPFAAPVSPAELSRNGYVVMTNKDGTRVYYAPDVPVLLSPEFETDHCFGLIAPPGLDSLFIGLTFQPVLARGPEISGTMLLEKATLKLVRVDFQYVNTEFPARVERVGGLLEFAEVESGAWYAKYWMLRMPRFRPQMSSFSPEGGAGGQLLAGYVETGATATPLDSVDLRAVTLGTRPTVLARSDTVGAADAPNDSAARQRAAGGAQPAEAAGVSPRAVCGRLDRPGVSSVAGIVRAAAGGPIPYATVSFDGGYLNATVSEPGGCFFVQSPQRKQLTMIVRRIGFHEVHQRVDLRGDSTAFVEVELSPLAITLNGVVVTAPRDEALAMSGFYGRMLDRKKGLGDGWFVTPEEIEGKNDNRVSHLLEGFPSVGVVYGSRNIAIPTGSGGCAMAVYVDGARVFNNPGEAMIGTTTGRALAGLVNPPPPGINPDLTDGVDNVIGGTNVAAIEIYARASQAPPQYQPLNGTCGVVLIWTKR